jgi:hypothetical protein
MAKRQGNSPKSRKYEPRVLRRQSDTRRDEQAYVLNHRNDSQLSGGTAAAAPGAGGPSPSTNDFRLTLSSGNPVYSPIPATPSSTVSDTCVFASPHGWTNGTVVTPSATGGGLTNGTLYDIHAISATVVSFHTNIADALSGANKVTLSASITAEIRPSGVANTTIYGSPYKGNSIGLYSGGWQIITSTEVSLALGTLTSGKNYDIFGYLNSGALALELGPVWTNDTTRATALSTQDGVGVKSGDSTRRYLGTIRSNDTTTTVDDGGHLSTQFGGKRFLWNAANRVRVKASVRDGSGVWTYGSATVRQANGSTGNKVEFVIGLSEDDIAAELIAGAVAAGSSATVGIGVDSITAYRWDSFFQQLSTAGGGGDVMASACRWEGRLSPGYHYIAWLEADNGGAGATFVGENSSGSLSRSGLVAVLMA